MKIILLWCDGPSDFSMTNFGIFITTRGTMTAAHLRLALKFVVVLGDPKIYL
jgi:hypothetical protein